MATKKDKLTILVDEVLIEQMKIRAIQEKRSVGQIAEELFRAYLAKGTKPTPAKSKAK